MNYESPLKLRDSILLQTVVDIDGVVHGPSLYPAFLDNYFLHSIRPCFERTTATGKFANPAFPFFFRATCASVHAAVHRERIVREEGPYVRERQVQDFSVIQLVRRVVNT